MAPQETPQTRERPHRPGRGLTPFYHLLPVPRLGGSRKNPGSPKMGMNDILPHNTLQPTVPVLVGWLPQPSATATA